MVSSYLICDGCGQFGPPAGFLSQDGLRLCYQCWFEAQRSEIPLAPEPSPGTEPGPTDPAPAEWPEPDR